MEAVAAGETSFPAVLDCTRYETCCLQCISLPPSPSSPRNTQQHSKIDALVDLQPYQRDLNSHCHKSSGILQSPHSSPHQVLVSQSTTTTHCTPRTLLWGSEEALIGTQLCFALILQTLGLMVLLAGGSPAAGFSLVFTTL